MQVGGNGYNGFARSSDHSHPIRDIPPHKTFARLDVDKSGGLSADELGESRLTRLTEKFDTADTDGSGTINSEEFAGFYKSEVAEARVSLAETVIQALTTLTEALSEIVEDYADANGVAPSISDSVEEADEVDVAEAGDTDAPATDDVIDIVPVEELVEGSEDIIDTEVAALNAAREAAEAEAEAIVEEGTQTTTATAGLSAEEAVLSLFENTFELLNNSESELSGSEFAQELYSEMQGILDQAS